MLSPVQPWTLRRTIIWQVGHGAGGEVGRDPGSGNDTGLFTPAVGGHRHPSANSPCTQSGSPMNLFSRCHGPALLQGCIAYNAAVQPCDGPDDRPPHPVRDTDLHRRIHHLDTLRRWPQVFVCPSCLLRVLRVPMTGHPIRTDVRPPRSVRSTSMMGRGTSGATPPTIRAHRAPLSSPRTLRPPAAPPRPGRTPGGRSPAPSSLATAPPRRGGPPAARLGSCPTWRSPH
jgi:hypothetical protein